VDARAVSVIEIPGDFTGPAHIAQGGIAAGLLAKALDGPAEVRLHAPPPLATPLRVEGSEAGLDAWRDDTLVLSARLTTVDVEVPRVDLERARRAGAAPAQSVAPHCIVCGDRHRRGLAIFPGPIDGSNVIGAGWTPPGWTAGEAAVVREEIVWGVLDCPGSWSFFVAGEFPDGFFPALGSIAVDLLAPVAVGEPVVVLGWPIEVEGRKYRAATALLAGDGTTLAVARQTCVAMPLDWAC
jgi:hypothetical protein